METPRSSNRSRTCLDPRGAPRFGIEQSSFLTAPRLYQNEATPIISASSTQKALFNHQGPLSDSLSTSKKKGSNPSFFTAGKIFLLILLLVTVTSYWGVPHVCASKWSRSVCTTPKWIAKAKAKVSPMLASAQHQLVFGRTVINEIKSKALVAKGIFRDSIHIFSTAWKEPWFQKEEPAPRKNIVPTQGSEKEHRQKKLLKIKWNALLYSIRKIPYEVKRRVELIFVVLKNWFKNLKGASFFGAIKYHPIWHSIKEKVGLHFVSTFFKTLMTVKVSKPSNTSTSKIGLCSKNESMRMFYLLESEDPQDNKILVENHDSIQLSLEKRLSLPSGAIIEQLKIQHGIFVDFLVRLCEQNGSSNSDSSSPMFGQLPYWRVTQKIVSKDEEWLKTILPEKSSSSEEKKWTEALDRERAQCQKHRELLEKNHSESLKHQLHAHSAQLEQQCHTKIDLLEQEVSFWKTNATAFQVAIKKKDDELNCSGSAAGGKADGIQPLRSYWWRKQKDLLSKKNSTTSHSAHSLLFQKVSKKGAESPWYQELENQCRSLCEKAAKQSNGKLDCKPELDALHKRLQAVSSSKVGEQRFFSPHTLGMCELRWLEAPPVKKKNSVGSVARLVSWVRHAIGKVFFRGALVWMFCLLAKKSFQVGVLQRENRALMDEIARMKARKVPHQDNYEGSMLKALSTSHCTSEKNVEAMTSERIINEVEKCLQISNEQLLESHSLLCSELVKESLGKPPPVEEHHKNSVSLAAALETAEKVAKLVSCLLQRTLNGYFYTLECYYIDLLEAVLSRELLSASLESIDEVPERGEHGDGGSPLEINSLSWGAEARWRREAEDAKYLVEMQASTIKVLEEQLEEVQKSALRLATPNLDELADSGAELRSSNEMTALLRDRLLRENQEKHELQKRLDLIQLEKL